MKLIKIEKEYDNYYTVTYKKLWKEKTMKVFIQHGSARDYSDGSFLPYHQSAAISSAINVMAVCNFNSLSLK